MSEITIASQNSDSFSSAEEEISESLEVRYFTLKVRYEEERERMVTHPDAKVRVGKKLTEEGDLLERNLQILEAQLIHQGISNVSNRFPIEDQFLITDEGKIRFFRGEGEHVGPSRDYKNVGSTFQDEYQGRWFTYRFRVARNYAHDEYGGENPDGTGFNSRLSPRRVKNNRILYVDIDPLEYGKRGLGKLVNGKTDDEIITWAKINLTAGGEVPLPEAYLQKAQPIELLGRDNF